MFEVAQGDDGLTHIVVINSKIFVHATSVQWPAHGGATAQHLTKFLGASALVTCLRCLVKGFV